MALKIRADGSKYYINDKETPVVPNDYKGSGASNWTGWGDIPQGSGRGSLYGPPPGSNNNNNQPARTQEEAKYRRWQSVLAHARQLYGTPGGAPQQGDRANYAPPGRMQFSGNMNMTGGQEEQAINKWNEFQRRRSLALSKPGGAPTDQGNPTPSRANLLPNQQSGIGQQMSGQAGGNLNAALMGASKDYAGPKG